MAETVHVKNMELRGVTVADTKISFIDGENGILMYRGYLNGSQEIHLEKQSDLPGMRKRIQNPVTPMRILGTCLLFTGAILIFKW